MIPRFTIRDLFWLTALAALAVWWCVDRWTIAKRLDNLEEFNTHIIQLEKDMRSVEGRLARPPSPIQNPSSSSNNSKSTETN